MFCCQNLNILHVTFCPNNMNFLGETCVYVCVLTVSSGSVTVNADSSVQLLAEEAVPLDQLDISVSTVFVVFHSPANLYQYIITLKAVHPYYQTTFCFIIHILEVIFQIE